ncbi:MAG: hypothetical protein WCG87_10965 [Bacteroidota bacterium]
MQTQSLLVSIYQSIEQTHWSSNKQKEKAIKVATSIFNLYVIYNYSFSEYISLASKYFEKILPSKRDYIIKARLIEIGILECNNSYNVIKHTSKGYRFNPKLLDQHKTNSHSFISINLSSNYSTISELFPHSQDIDLYDFYKGLFSRISIDDDIDSYIQVLSTICLENLVLNNHIKDDYVNICFGNRDYRYERNNAIKAAHKQGKELIKFKDKFYFDDLNEFIIKHSLQLKLVYSQMVFNIKNHVFYCSRNDTNNRLDYNMTGLKKELFTKMKLDGEPLVEIDISNAQFAIAATNRTSCIFFIRGIFLKVIIGDIFKNTKSSSLGLNKI